MLNVSAATWNALSQLLDEALNLEPAARAEWLAQLATTQPQLAPTLQRLLAAETSSETADILARAPRLASLLEESRPTALAARARVGPYRLKRELGAGGMADVWLAERADGAFTRDVALKLPIMTRLRRDLAQRFARERDILARLEHPHIARLYDAGVSEDGLPYLAMEYVDGLPITHYCDTHKLEIAARLRLFGQVLDAVQFAHASLVIHRDLKPSNILVAASGEVRLLDFGIAKLLAENDIAHETQLTQMAGRAMTPDYASPEQIKGESLTIATDVYSLGVVLYELLAGCRPYRLKVQSSAQLENAILATEPSKPSSALTNEAAHARGMTMSRLCRMLSGDLDTIALKALAKAPADRYLTIAAFAEDLQRHLDGRPVRARPTSWSYRAKKFIARNKLVAGAATAAVLSLLIGTGVAGWQAHQARTDQRRAEQVKAFLASIFVDIDPNYGQGARVPASAILLKASSRIDNEFGADPRLALEVATLVSNGLVETNESKAGRAVIEAALKRYESRLSSSDPQLLRARGSELRAHAAAGTLSLIAGKLPELIAKLRATDAPLTEELVFALISLATVESGSESMQPAVAATAEAAEIATRRLGENHKVSIEALHHWSNMLLGAENTVEAGAVAERGLRTALAVYQRPHPMISNLERMLAIVLMRTGRPRDAAALLAQILEDEKTVHGDGTPPVANAQFHLGYALVLSGQLRAGLEHLQLGQEGLERLTPDDHQDHLMRRITVAATYNISRLPEQALHTLDEANRAARAAGVDVDQSPLRLSRCAVLIRLGLFAEAAAEYRALETIIGRAPPLEQARASTGLALLARLEGRATDAVTAANAAIASAEKLPLMVTTRAIARAELGLALLEAGDLAAADGVLRTSRAEFSEGQVGPSPLVLDVELGLARVALSQGKRAEAVALLDEALKYWREVNPTGLDAAEFEYWHARASGLPPSAATMKTLRASPYPLHRKWISAAATKA